MEESHFIEGSDSDSGRSDSTDCMFETFNEKKDLSNTAASSRKLLSILSAKISKVSERKPIAKYEDNVFVEKSDIQKNDGKTDISSLSYTLRGIPKLLDLHSARLKQGKTNFFYILLPTILMPCHFSNQTTLSQTSIVITRDRLNR